MAAEAYDVGVQAVALLVARSPQRQVHEAIIPADRGTRLDAVETTRHCEDAHPAHHVSHWEQ